MDESSSDLSVSYSALEETSSVSISESTDESSGRNTLKSLTPSILV